MQVGGGGHVDVQLVLFVVGTLFLVALAARLVADSIRQRRRQPLEVRIETGTNDDDQAVGTFIEVLNHATRSLIVHDDGNCMDGTVYNDPKVIQAVESRLETCPDLVVKCLFNVEEELAMVHLLRDKYADRFQVRYRTGPRPGFNVHYKIADAGCIGHFSDHDFGAAERDYELYDCTTVGQTERNAVFKKYVTRFHREFNRAKAAA